MQRSKQLLTRRVTQLVAIIPLTMASVSLAGPAGRLLHTNQGDLVGHSNQEGTWAEMLNYPFPAALPSTPVDPFAIDLRDVLSHGNSPSMPRMTTPHVGSIPAPATLSVLGLAGLLPTGRRRQT